jgi:hypothetical protein
MVRFKKSLSLPHVYYRAADLCFFVPERICHHADLELPERKEAE